MTVSAAATSAMASAGFLPVSDATVALMRSISSNTVLV